MPKYFVVLDSVSTKPYILSEFDLIGVTLDQAARGRKIAEIDAPNMRTARDRYNVLIDIRGEGEKL